VSRSIPKNPPGMDENLPGPQEGAEPRREEAGLAHREFASFRKNDPVASVCGRAADRAHCLRHLFSFVFVFVFLIISLIFFFAAFSNRIETHGRYLPFLFLDPIGNSISDF